VVYFFFNFE